MSDETRAARYGREMADGAWRKASASRRRAGPRPSARSLRFFAFNALELAARDADEATFAEALARARVLVSSAFEIRWRALQVASEVQS